MKIRCLACAIAARVQPLPMQRFGDPVTGYAQSGFVTQWVNPETLTVEGELFARWEDLPGFEIVEHPSHRLRLQDNGFVELEFKPARA